MTKAKSVLTAEQRKAAKALGRQRPPVIAGTNVIPDNKQRAEWFDKVTAKMRELGLSGRATGEFCDIAGVPD